MKDFKVGYNGYYAINYVAKVENCPSITKTLERLVQKS